MKKLKFLISIAVATLLTAHISAQQVIATSGGAGQNASGSITYTLGEVVIETYNGTDKKLTQGFQQSRLIITAVSELQGLSYSVAAFPNPTTNFLKLKLEKDFPETLDYLLMDINGKVISSGKIENGETDISFESLAVGTYFVKVIQDKKEVKTIKVVKQ
jgi:hypothetical protein